MARVSFDSGVLIALERGDQRAWAWMQRAVERRESPLVSCVAVAECWRDGRTQPQLARIIDTCDVENVDLPLAQAAGEACRSISDATVTDALIAALAAREGALLVTDDPDDLSRLAERHIRGLRLATFRH